MTRYQDERAIAFYAADKISTEGYYNLDVERLKELRLPKDTLERKVNSLNEQLGNTHSSYNEVFTKINKTLGRDLAIEKFIKHTSGKERFICFNDLIRQSTNENGTRFFTGEQSVFDISNISFALLYEYVFENSFFPLFNIFFGRVKSKRYAPVIKGKDIEIEISENKYSNSIKCNRKINNVLHQEFIGNEFNPKDYYLRYRRDMLTIPSDIISDYFDRYKDTVTRAELGTIYFDYFIPDEMSKFTYRNNHHFPRY